jgi:Tol biopolymer transport system component
VKIADDVVTSNCSPDGKWALFTKSNRKLYRISLDGGTPIELVTPPQWFVNEVEIAPDAKSILYEFEQPGTPTAKKIAIALASGGEPLHTFDYPGKAEVEVVHWSPDGKGVQYLSTSRGATNVWEFPVVGGAPHQVTNFTSGRIFDFDWARNGKTLFLAKGDVTRDVVLISKVH